jgi:hypothetical protein
MQALTFDTLLASLPDGRTRRRYERLARQLAGKAIGLRLPYLTHPIWLVQDSDSQARLANLGVPETDIWPLPVLQEVLSACGSHVGSLDEAARVLAETRAD